jgi:uncharacterized protein YhfF
MKAIEMWELYKRENQINHDNYQAWSFGVDKDILSSLVEQGIKTGTASAHVYYDVEKEPLPQVEDYSVILDSKEEAVCVIKTTKVYVTSFNQVSTEHAFKEGEGDRSLEYWRKVHKDFFCNELKNINLDFSEDMKVVCEEFVVIYKR